MWLSWTFSVTYLSSHLCCILLANCEWVASYLTGSDEIYQREPKNMSFSFVLFSPKEWWSHVEAWNKKTPNDMLKQKEKCIFKQPTKREKQEIWTFNCLSFHFYCKRAKFYFDFCGWVVGSGVLILFQFCPCWTLPPSPPHVRLPCLNIMPHPVPSPVTLFSSPVPSSSNHFFFLLLSCTCCQSVCQSSPVSLSLSVAPSHVNTYYCINQHHNFSCLAPC